MIANHPLAWFDDLDSGRTIRVGQTISGNIDFPSDVDFLLLHLAKDERVEIFARSALGDPYLIIVRTDVSHEEADLG